ARVHRRGSARDHATTIESIPLNFAMSRPIARAATAAMGHTVLGVFNKTPQERRTVMVGFDELKGKASEALQNEEQTDSALDKAADFIDEKTGGEHADKIQQGRDVIDGKTGDEGQQNKEG